MTRQGRAVALALVLAVVGIAGLRPALRSLASERARGATLAGIAAAPPPAALLAPGAALRADGAPAAAAALAATLHALAARERLLVEALAPDTSPASEIVTARLAVSGESRRVLRFAEAVESRAPAIRFARWRLDRRGDVLRLEAEAAMAWEPAE